jgi:alpha-1,2-mannosyltransferase
MDRRWLRALLALIALLMLADFVFRGIVPAVKGEKNDFSEVYVGAWMWRHGQNFYDAELATATGSMVANTHAKIVLIYPPSALVFVAPFTFLPWSGANVVWMVISLGAIFFSIVLLVRLAGVSWWEDRALVLGTFFLAFDPLHQAFHLGNVAVMVVPLCLLGICLAEKKSDLAAGVVLGVATALKPQLGFWVLAFYLVQLRRRVFFGAAVPAIGLVPALLRYPVPLQTLISGYRGNLQYWFAPGRLYGFTEGALPFHVNEMQVLLYQLIRDARAASLLAYFLFGCGLVVWGFAVWRARVRVFVPLAVSCLLALSFICFYHSVADVTMLTLALCWILDSRERSMDWSKRAACVIFLLLMLPGHSALMRLSPHLNPRITESFWWNFFVARYFVWLLAGINVVLLRALFLQARVSAKPGRLYTGAAIAAAIQ